MTNKNLQRTSIATLGEFGLIKRLTENFTITNSNTLKGVGDDAAVLDLSGKKTVITTDVLVEGVHFNLSYMPLKHLGYKAVTVNLSDIYAMNAQATQILVSVGVSNRFPVEALEELYAGIQKACTTYQVDLIGGDTSSSQKGLFISVTALGVADKEKITYRTGAGQGDLLVVTGDLAAAYLGFQVLERERQVFEINPKSQPDLSPYTYLIERQLKPEARKDIPLLLEQLDVLPTSMIDISDGLSSEIIHLCKSSNVGCNLYEEKIPLDPQVISTCEELNIEATTMALNGGEDYELLCTIKQGDYNKIKGNPNFTVIGHMVSENESMHLITRDEQKLPITAQGWNAFLKKEK